jgi:hypothetical protein
MDNCRMAKRGVMDSIDVMDSVKEKGLREALRLQRRNNALK